MSLNPQLVPLHYRSIWISDVHLGLRGCQADYLLDFLESTQCKRLYLVGDILDLWAMRSKVFWPQAHNNVVRAILGKARNGTEVIFLPGNHDETFRAHLGTDFGKIAVRDQVIHETADKRRFLVLHGDQFDGALHKAPLAAKLGGWLYDLLLIISHRHNQLRRRLGLNYWSLAAFLKQRLGRAMRYIDKFERMAAGEGRKQGVDGVICGHIHKAASKDIDGIAYRNCGDWVESCTALVEQHDGKIELLHWVEARQSLLPATWQPNLSPASDTAV